MNIRKTFILASCAIAAILPALAQAHYLWAVLSPDKDIVTIGLQESPAQSALSLGTKSTSVKAWSSSGLKISLAKDEDSLTGILVSDCGAASLDYGVVDAKDQGRGVFWLKYYAKTAANPAASQRIVGLPLELTLAVSADGTPFVTVLQDGKPVQGADVVVPGADEASFEAKSGADGTVSLPKQKAPFAVRALVTSNTKGTHDGKSYDLTRTYCTLTVENDQPKVDPNASFSTQIHNSFGDDHEIVSNTDFINAALSHTITKEQLEAHLQQRALIHETMDKILEDAKVSDFGKDQKMVQTYLRSDMKLAGIPWPKESQAWPLTKAFLDELKESTKKGPWFALGVFHVYYGGITHGGRYIGKEITDTLKTRLDYYQKSDGYAEYLRGFNKLSDPKAREEVLRGGQEAYRYVIAINDADYFKSN